MTDVEMPSRSVCIRVEAFNRNAYARVVEAPCRRHPMFRVPAGAVPRALVAWRQGVKDKHPQALAALGRSIHD